MAAAAIVMVLILAVAIGVVAVVAMGMQGAWRDRAPELADTMAEAARHLNGDAEPPPRLVEFVEELPDLRRKVRGRRKAG